MTETATTLQARAFVDELARVGVRHLVIAPGSRSTPLVLAAHGDPRFRLWTWLDERAGAFFALGLGKATGRPAAVITTSGTAAANLFPAVVEASQDEVPLLLITADRPPRLRGADANQAIDQLHLFGRYARAFLELPPPSSEADAVGYVRQLACRGVAATLGLPAGPVQVNAPFAKPLEPVAGGGSGDGAPGGRPDGAPMTRIGVRRALATGEEVEFLADLLRSTERAILVAGPVPEPWRTGPALLAFARITGLPLLPDPLSGARWGPARGVRLVGSYDLLLREPGHWSELEPGLVLRVGRTPGSAAFTHFLEGTGARQVILDPGGRWKDHLVQAQDVFRVDGGDVLERAAEALEGPTVEPEWADRWVRLDGAARQAAAEATARGFFEGTVAAQVVRAAPEGAHLFVGSSMPVRDVDTFGAPREELLLALGNRGASGIDGSVSTALGVAASGKGPVVALLGDVAFHHDLTGLQGARDLPVLFVVVHNDGGGIFHMLPIREHEPAFTTHFATPHGLDFRHAASLYGLPYRRLGEGDGSGVDGGDVARALEEELSALGTDGGARILVIRSDREVNRRRHEEVFAAVREALRSE